MPVIQLQANRLEKKANLECTLKLDGAIRPTQLNISIPYSNESDEHILLYIYCYVFTMIYYIGEDNESDENQLCIDDLQDVFSSLIKADKDWFELGLALGIQVDTLEGIKSRENSDKARLCEMLTHWL